MKKVLICSILILVFVFSQLTLAAILENLESADYASATHLEEIGSFLEDNGDKSMYVLNQDDTLTQTKVNDFLIYTALMEEKEVYIITNEGPATYTYRDFLSLVDIYSMEGCCWGCSWCDDEDLGGLKTSLYPMEDIQNRLEEGQFVVITEGSYTGLVGVQEKSFRVRNRLFSPSSETIFQKVKNIFFN